MPPKLVLVAALPLAARGVSGAEFHGEVIDQNVGQTIGASG
ncbi:hypothetical protein [Aminobacter sp. BE322]